MVGRTLAHYRINRAIGAGGMGEVYRATDLKLGREVALKVLPQGVANDPERLARFEREARAVAALNHPSVVTLYSVEQSDGIHFLTMELVEGQSLDRLIPTHGLPLERIFEIAGALAEALAAAHEKGIIHRDLKPANVMVTNEGRVKVLDFGLAKDVGAETLGDATLTSAGHTKAGMVMGTPAYMSPEQVSGRTLDHRTDIFSLGVLLHEMATGRRPFEETSSAELISSILRDDPPSVTDLRADLPSDLARVIRRCLEKDPRHRLQTARDVANEFRDLTRTASRSAPTPPARARAAAESGAARADEGFWIAVLPFKYTGSNADLAGLAEGLADEIITAMSRFSYLRVIARSSTARYAQQAVDVRAVAKELGARYVIDGSIRQAGAKIRIAAQLVDADSGAGLWAATYDRAFTAEATLDLLDDVVPRIVSTVGDTQGILAHSMTDALRHRDPETLTPYEAVLRSFGYHQLVSEAEHRAGMAALEQAVKRPPQRADCWAMLSWLYRGEFTHGFNARPDPLARSMAAARRAIELDPAHSIGHAALASVLFCMKDFAAFRTAAKRALALNRMEGYATAYLGLQMAYAGDWEEGCALAERATQLNPNHPGWYWFPLALDAYRQLDGRQALEYALKVNMPGLWTSQLTLAVIYSQLGEMEKAREARNEMLRLKPNFAATAREELGKWWQPQMVEQLLGDLYKAGLETSAEKAEAVTSRRPAGAAASNAESGARRVAEGFWVAVLPFKYPDSHGDLAALADGLTDDMITGMSRFPYINVIARSSTARYAREAIEVRTVGKELGARYVMEGNLRQSGAKIRIAVQLVDAASGAHIWAESYERPFSAEAVFQTQDELVPRIVSTIADTHGVLPHTLSEAVRSKHAQQMTPYEAILRSFCYHERLTPAEHQAARTALERAVEIAPSYGYAWAMLSLLYADEHAQGFNPQPDSLHRALQAARKAVDLDPSNHRSFQALANAHFHRKEIAAFRTAAERAIALNPMDGCAVANMGGLIASSGDWEHGCAIVKAVLQQRPNHPGWFWFPLFHNAYRQREYREALSLALKINLPGYFFTHVALAVAHAQLGEQQAAGKAVQELLAALPDFPKVSRQLLSVWLDPDLTEHYIDGLRKAGLDIPSIGATAVPAPDSSLSPAKSASGATRAEEGFWVAVLPFRHKGGDAALEALADGLTDEIIAGLSRFSYLRVIARGTTAKYSREADDVRSIGQELGARYVMEGNLRQAGTTIRLAVQLVDAATGAHLWAETFERGYRAEEIFLLQDEFVPRIVSTVADQHGVLTRSICAAIRKKSDDQWMPYEAVFRVFALHENPNAVDHAACRDLLERLVREAPSAADCWAMLATLYADEDWFGFNRRPDPLGRSMAAAQRAAELAPASALAGQALAQSLFMRREWQAFRPVAERTIALNPMEGATVAVMGIMLACSGEWERGCAVTESAMNLHPNFPGWYWLTAIFDAYRRRDYRKSLEVALRVQLPGYLWNSIACAAAYGQLGERAEAEKYLRELLAPRPNFAVEAREELGKWFAREMVEHYLEGLEKAGLPV